MILKYDIKKGRKFISRWSMTKLPLIGKTTLITGAAKRIGRHLAITAAAAGSDVIIHHAESPVEAEHLSNEIKTMGRKAWTLQYDFNNLEDIELFLQQAFSFAKVDFLVNNAAIFEPLNMQSTTLSTWQKHFNINLTVPFLLSQEFAAHLGDDGKGRIVNILDWRALRPGLEHFPYTISKAALASMTQAMARTLAPNILVNGIAFGAILAPNDETTPDIILKNVPIKRFATLEEVSQTLMFLLDGPEYITGEIIHLDGGRHLV
jgi:NAD(P)-dependent dehydrogenase (short-subunit alcohol dehydrogenase family)